MTSVASLRRLARERTEVMALVMVVVATLLWSYLTSTSGMPAGIYALGLVGGAGLALHGLGIVLVYRANRVINLAQVQMAAVGGSLFVELAQRRTFVRGVAAACPSCVPAPETVGDLLSAGGGPRSEALIADPQFRNFAELPLTDERVERLLPPGLTPADLAIDLAPGWMVQANYWLSMLVAISLSALLVWIVYVGVIKRFNQAPRLVLTVVTLAAGSFARVLSNTLLGLAFRADAGVGEGAAQQGSVLRVPIDFRVRLDPAVLNSTHLLVLVSGLGAAVILGLYFRSSRAGIVLRGAAENPHRAQTLGVNVDGVTGRVWIIAGLLSGVASVLTVALSGEPTSDGYDVIVRVLTAAVVGGMVSLALVVAGALVIGVIDQVVLFATSSQALVDGVLLAIVVVLLLAQTRRAGRAETESQASWQGSRELRPMPAELRGIPAVKKPLRALAVLGVLVAVGYPWFMSPSQTNLAVVTMVYAMVGLSLLILTGWAGQISFAQMAFAGVGAWVAAVLGWPFALAVIAGAAAGGITAVVVGVPALRLRGLHLAIATLAFGLAVSSVLLNGRHLGRMLPESLDRPMLLGIDFEDQRAFFYLALVVLTAAVAATLGLRRSRIARVLIACKDNEAAAQSFGINLLRARLVAFAISGAMAGFAGAVLAFAQNGVEPDAFGPTVSVRLFFVVLIGGLGSIAGPLLGAVYLGLLQILLGTGFRDLAALLLDPGLGLLVLLIFMPGGLAQALWAVRNAWLRRLALRLGIDVPSLNTGSVDGVVPIAPNERPDGAGTMVVPKRYRMPGQWMIEDERERRQKIDV